MGLAKNARAGMRVGDFLVRSDGHRLRSPIEFQRWLYLAGIGTTIGVAAPLLLVALVGAVVLAGKRGVNG